MKALREVVCRQQMNASADRVWARVSDHAGMAAWLGVSRAWLSRPGWPDPNGMGAERTLVDALAGTVVEQVVDWQPVQSYRYRIIAGSPFRDHSGEVTLTPASPQSTVLQVTIRFRPRWPGTGWLLEFLLGAKLRPALIQLKALVEAG